MVRRAWGWEPFHPQATCGYFPGPSAFPVTKRDDHAEPPLSDLDRRLEAAQARRRKGNAEGRSDGMGAGMRIAIDLVAAVAVGTGLGIALDRWLGTSPWLLLLFFLLGSAAGVLNVIRTAHELERRRREGR